MENLEWKDKVDGQDDILAEDINAIAKYANELNDGKVDKVGGKGLSANDFTNEYKGILDSRIVKLPSSGYAENTNLITSQAVYKMIYNVAREWDTETFESLLFDFIEPLANSIPMQKIYEKTTTETVVEITDNALENLKLDEIYVYIKLGAELGASSLWCCSVNGITDPTGYLYYFETKTTGKYFMVKSKRMCKNQWFAQKFNNLSSGINNQPLYAGYSMAGIDYINSIKIICPGLPAGSTITVCGRKVVE